MISYRDIYEKVFLNERYSRNEDRIYTSRLIYDYLQGSEQRAIDIGSGRGPVVKELLTSFSASQILSTDLKKFHDFDVPFMELDLTSASSRGMVRERFDFLTCFDVLEHIEEKELDNILLFFLGISRRSLIVVANHSDVWGMELHLIQEPMSWWEERLKTYFQILDKKSLYNDRAYLFYMEGLCSKN